MDVKNVIASQYHAALEMLRQSINKCPDALWNRAEDKVKFWHLAYHALFYTHLYLQESESTFTVWHKHRDEYQFIGQLPFPPHRAPHIGAPYDKTDVLEYVDFCDAQVDEQTQRLNFDAASGFGWLPFGKLELQIYSIRHIQQHAGELMERLGRANIEIDWVGKLSNK